MMSGTSLDGLDMALCDFTSIENKWEFTIRKAETIPYPLNWKERLGNMHQLDAHSLWKMHIDYGHYLGEMANAFLTDCDIEPHLICSHGHTVFHQPRSGFTMQAGDGAAIASKTRLPVIFDFRSADVALGGQGAPLVPVGDMLLFPQYLACINIGGFSNISYDRDGSRIAFDICPANIILNHLANHLEKEYDDKGEIARNGKLIQDLLEKMDSLDYYTEAPPKSLGREWLEDLFIPLIDKRAFSPADLMRTCVEHIGSQIGKALENLSEGKVLITGGGAHNEFLVKTIAKYSRQQLVIPDRLIVDYKESLVFAFLGVLRWEGKINVLASVTGSKRDHSGGTIVKL
jgi:anhydro-N-acetylmuramic acid kinase